MVVLWCGARYHYGNILKVIRAPMEKVDLEDILNQWNILDESERWSLKAQFYQEYPDEFKAEDFIRFLEKHRGDRDPSNLSR